LVIENCAKKRQIEQKLLSEQIQMI
jgi:hypothetical protein